MRWVGSGPPTAADPRIQTQRANKPRRQGVGMSTEPQPGVVAKGDHPGSGKDEKKIAHRKESTQGRAASLLIAPTIIVLCIVILYPVVLAVIQSFQKDSGLDPVTGLFVAGGFAGFSNYTHWILQQCTAGGATVPCPPGNLGAQFWSSIGTTFFFAVATVILETALGFGMAVIMARTFRGRGLLRASVLVPWAIPTAPAQRHGADRGHGRRG